MLVLLNVFALFVVGLLSMLTQRGYVWDSVYVILFFTLWWQVCSLPDEDAERSRELKWRSDVPRFRWSDNE